ncbi:putative L-type lectin-domain containing receptor kinase S.4-like [Iris pallida]|uniref:non-specific serine/threonine protein kinase n=1 Tax=Iris pallida TaxID=29817 RepID=A0AAX6FEZ7_IRIPA|nr:putative L-type lectin-domain containing receptor kinase S.4-like [Iris pallida]
MSKTSIVLSISLFITILSPTISQEFTYLGFSGSKISLNGAASIEGDSGILRLTNETSRLIGHAFYPTPLKFKNSSSASAFSFSTAFAFAIVPEYPKLGGHGFAFTIAPSPILPGAQPSQYLGILNASDITNATDHVFAVEFDTVQDFEFFDINDNHVGIDINNLKSNSSAPAAYFDESSTKKDLNLKSGNTIQAWVDYDGVAKVINVSLSPFSWKPTIPIISFPVDLSTVLEDDMYVGFSASTGLLASSHYLMGWSFKMNGVAPSLQLSSLPSLPKPKRSNTTLIVAVAISVFFVLIAVAAAAAYLFYKFKNADIVEPWELEYGPHRFSYNELRHATKNFRDRDQPPRLRRLRQGLPGGPPGLESRGRREKSLPRLEAGVTGVHRGDRQHRASPPPQPRPPAGLVPPPRGAAAGLRLHAQRQPRQVPVRHGQLLVVVVAGAVVGGEVQGPEGRGERAAVPARGMGGGSDPSGRQGEQCAARHRHERPARGLRAGEAVRARGEPEHDAGGRHARVPGAGAYEDGEGDDGLGRVRVRGAVLGDDHGAEADRAEGGAGGAGAGGLAVGEVELRDVEGSGGQEAGGELRRGGGGGGGEGGASLLASGACDEADDEGGAEVFGRRGCDGGAGGEVTPG